MKKKYLLVVFVGVSLLLVSGFIFLKSKPKQIENKTISKEKTRSMLSYTLDGEKTDIKPTKESGYIANKIICENGSNLIWDNTNWEVEIISLESNDVCSVDFTTNESTNGYRVTATTNIEGSIDSLSKATIENGTVVFYPNKGQEITGVSGCTGVVEKNKVIVSNITSNQTCNISMKVPTKNLYTLLSDGSKYEQWTRTSTSKYDEINKTEVGFNSVLGGTSITQGYNSTGKIYKIDNNNYYFAGNPSDNWVYFADKWWRIIRTNNNEGTRLLYAGTSHDGQDGYINNTTYKWYSQSNNINYVQWNYANNTIGNALINWYNLNITEANDTMVKAIVYCNDISYREDLYTGIVYFGALDRLKSNISPSNVCETNGFGSASKVGLMTADEVAYAGGLHGSDSANDAPNTYYYRNSIMNGCSKASNDLCSVTGNIDWWTMSPSSYGNGNSWMFYVDGGAGNNGRLTAGAVSYNFVVRPVITLLPSIKVSGSGTTDDPFIPSL